MVEWQTRRTQNPLVAIPCGFKSHHRHQTESGRNSRPGFFVSPGFELAAGGWQGLIYSSFQLLFLCLYFAVSINSPLLSTSFFCKRTLSATKKRVVTRFFRVTTLFCRLKFPPIAAHSAGVLCPSAHVRRFFFACWMGGNFLPYKTKPPSPDCSEEGSFSISLCLSPAHGTFEAAAFFFFTQIPFLSPCEIPFLLMKPNIVRSERNFLLM